jgi:hypothetical protein
MAPVSLSGISSRPQWSRRRRCLLKDCGQRFKPSHRKCRYCSVACRQAARRWRGWRAQQKYRASRNGRERRQQQACRYRQRCRSGARPAACAAVVLCPPVTGAWASSCPLVTAASSCPLATAACAAAVGSGSNAGCEGKRTGAKSEEVWLCPCERPGCYVLFAVGSANRQRRFCCALCRKAMRCVLQREARWRRRRRRGLKRSGRRARRQTRGP